MGFGQWALVFLVLAASVAFGQSGAVNGHIVDAAGSAVQGAEVTITNAATNQMYAVRTNGEGYYQFPSLTPGAYVIHASAAGFGKVTIDGVQLEVGGSRAIDVILKPESVTQDITVTASAPELVVDHPDRGNVIESEFVENMPLNIRNPLQMVNFAQGVTAFSIDSGNNDASEAFTNTFRINGGKLATTESLLDGAANTTLYDYNAIAAVPQVDSIQEFKVLTDAYAPEWGRTSGGIVTFATKSGSDRIHGSVFEYLRNSDLDANSFNSDVAGLAKPHFERNQYGYALGGPVAFPPRYRESGHRTFFYSTYEGLRQSQAGNFTYTVPTNLERQGDFSQTLDTNGNLIVIYDPRTTTLQPAGSTACTASPVPASSTVYCRSPFSGNKIPSQYLDTAGGNILAKYPLPNQTGQGLSSVNNFFSNAPTSSIQDTVNLRIDHRFSERQSIFGRYDWFQRYNYFGDPYKNGLSPTSNHQRLPGDNTMLDHTWTITPNIVFEHHFVYAHQESNRIPETLGYDPTQLGFNSSIIAGLPSVTFPDVTGNRISALGPQSGLEADGGTTYEYAAAVTQLKGKHSLKFGFDYRSLSEDLHINQLVSVSSTYTTSFTAGPNPQAALGDSGSGIADLLLGTGTVTSGIVPGFQIDHPYYAVYAQDEYHITPKLAITYGLRYNIEMPDTEEHNQYQYLDLTSSSPLNSQVTSLGGLTGGPGFPGVNGAGTRFQSTQYINFDPRAGFAYRWDDKTVVRGGFGVFHAPSVDGIVYTSQGYSAVTTSNPALANGVTPQFNMDNPFPSGLNPVTGSSLGLDTNAGLNIAGTPRKQVVSYSEQWSLDIQRELPYNFVVTAGYVGNHGLHLYEPYNYNELPDSDLSLGTALTATVANPFYGVITNPTSPLSAKTIQQGQLLRPHPQFLNMTANLLNTGSSNYNALQLSLEHRFSQGLSLLFAYTHSKMFDNVSDYLGVNFVAVQYQDVYCPACDRSISGQDLPDVIRMSGQYELPFGQGKPFANHGLLSQTVGGWSVGSFFQFDDGLPVQVTSPNNSNSFGGGTTMRPDVVPGVSTSVPGGPQIKNGGLYFNPKAFTPTPAFQFGNAPRYLASVRSPGTLNFDMLAEKKIPIVEPFALNFRVEFFNAFNRIQFAGPNASISSTSFGEIFLNQLNTPRDIQASLRLSF
jgi:hypothetical protein